MVNKKKQENKEIEFEVASDNIFADIGVNNPEDELTKAELAWEIEQIIKKKKLTQKKAAEIMGINQPKVSALLSRQLTGFSVERLMHFLNALGQDIDIVLKPTPHSRKTGRVTIYSSRDCSGYRGNSSIAAKGR